MVTYEELKQNIDTCRAAIDEASALAGRRDRVSIIGATKTQPRELIDMIERYSLLSDVGENHVQEITQKYSPSSPLKWHMIGRLQSNKVKYVVGKVALIHSLDRASLADEIQTRASRMGIKADCLVEINMGGELSKGGVAPQQLERALEDFSRRDALRLRGLMCVMPKADEDELKRLYASFYELYNRAASSMASPTFDTLSCGMSNDFSLAIRYGGATTVRLGRVLFGERNYAKEEMKNE